MRVPAFMLKKLYVPGSLQQEGDEVRFKLRNTLANATVTEPPEVQLDGAPIEQGDLTAHLDGDTLGAADVSEATPLALTKGAEVEMRIAGRTISPGAHRIGIKVSSKEWGLMEFEVEDKL